MLSLLLPYILLSGLHPLIPGWETAYHGLWPAARCLRLRPSGRVCIEENLLKGPVYLTGTVIFPSGTCSMSRLRSLPSGALLASAICATKDISPDPGVLLSLLPETGVNPETFRTQFPVLDTVRFKGQEGLIVRDGPGRRAYFLLTGLDDGSLIRFLAETARIQDGGETRLMQQKDLDFLLDLPRDTLLYLTASLQDGRLTGLTFLGGLMIRKNQDYREDVLSDIQALSEKGREVFTQRPVSGDGGALLPPSPVPCHAAEDCLMLRQTGPGAAGLLEACSEEAYFCSFSLFLFLLSGLMFIMISVYTFLSNLHMSAGLLIMLIASGYLIFNGRRQTFAPAVSQRLLAAFFLVFFLNIVISLVLIQDRGGTPALLHGLSLGLVLSLLPPCIFRRLNPRNRTFLLCAAVIFVLFALTALLSSGLTGLFLILLNACTLLCLVLLLDRK